MRVLGLVDLHWSGVGEPRLPELRGVDLVLLGGDLTNFRGAQVARRLVEAIRARGPRILAVCGNCDRPEVEDYLVRIGIGLDRRGVVEGGAKFLGMSAGLPFGGCPYERTEEEYATCFRELAEAERRLLCSGPTVWLCHQPPFGTACDRVHGRHVGSHSVRRAIEEMEPDLVFCGHIHEGIGIDRIGNSRIVNPGPWAAGHYLEFEVADGRLGEVRLV